MLITAVEADIQEDVQREVDLLRASFADLIPQITICTGCTECRSDAMTANQLIAQADEQLYVHKEKYHGKKDAAGAKQSR